MVRPPLGTYSTLCHSCCPGPWHSDVHAQLHLHCLNGFYQASDSHTDQGRVGVDWDKIKKVDKVLSIGRPKQFRVGTNTRFASTSCRHIFTSRSAAVPLLLSSFSTPFLEEVRCPSTSCPSFFSLPLSKPSFSFLF